MRMKNLIFAFLLFLTLMNFNNAFSMDERFDERVAHYMSLGVNQEDATTIAFTELTGSGSGSGSRSRPSRDVPTEYKIDAASANLIAQLTLADQAAGERATADLSTTARGIHESTIVQILQFNANITTHRGTIAPLVTFLGSIPQGADVHVLDGTVPGNMAALHAIGDDFAVDNSALTVANMRDYLLPRTTGYAGYDGTAVTPA